MHVLTKIFIVLVSLLAVLLVPLVIVYAHNENSYQQRYQQSEAQAAAARSLLETAQASHGAALTSTEAALEEARGANRELRKQTDRQEAELRGLEFRLAEAESMKATINAKLSTLASAVDAGQQLNQSLIEETRALRQDALALERRSVELDEALRDTRAQLDVAEQARRATQEELQRLKNEQVSSLQMIEEFIARYGAIDVGDVRAGTIGPPVNVELDAAVIRVRRNLDQVYAEIDAGSRDGVQVGWELTIGRGGRYVGRLRIISVDINRATGIIELEQGQVQQGDRALARPRR